MKKRLVSVFLVAALVSSFFSVACDQFAAVQAATDVSGIIGSSTTWMRANSPYNLTDKVLIDAGVTVTVESGATINFNGNYIRVNGALIIQPGAVLNMGPFSTGVGEIDVNGVMTAIGTSSNPIHFNGGTLEYPRIIPFAPSPQTSCVSFASSSVPWNEQTSSGCTIQNAVLDKMKVETGTSIKTSNNQINDTEVSVWGGSPIISNNVLFYSGIDVEGGSATITNNQFTSGSIIMYPDCDSLTITNNVISAGTVEYTSTMGVHLGGEYNGYGTILIEKNVIKDNSVGIDIASSEGSDILKPIMIRHNTIVNNAVAICIGAKFSRTISNNNIYNNNASIILQYVASNNVDAANNWWGTTDTATINNLIYDFYDDFDLGKVNYTPFLTSPDPDAPNPDSLPVSSTPSQGTPTSTSTLPTEPPATLNPEQTTAAFPLFYGLNFTELVVLAVLIVVAVLLIVDVHYRRRGKPTQNLPQPPPPPA